MNVFDWPEFTPRGTCNVAAAVLGGSVLTAGAQMWGANKAASAQTEMGNRAIGAQREMFDVTRNALQPFITGGQGGIGDLAKWLNVDDESGPLNALRKLTMPGSNMTDTLRHTPGFEFAEDRGLRAVNNALAARGLGGSGGAVAKGASEFTTGLASNTWQSVVNALQNLFMGGAGAKQSFVNTGANAAAGLGGNATQVGGQIGSNLVGIGNAQGGAATATGNALGNVGGGITTAALIQKLLGGGTNPAGGTGLYPTSMAGDSASGFQPYPSFG